VNRLYKILQEDPVLGKDIAMFGIAVKNTPRQAEAYRAGFRVPFPVFSDESGIVYEAAGKPSYPSLLMATTSGRVLLRHEGMIRDYYEIIKEIRKIHESERAGGTDR